MAAITASWPRLKKEKGKHQMQTSTASCLKKYEAHSMSSILPSYVTDSTYASNIDPFRFLL
jgi:hypothetical protein